VDPAVARVRLVTKRPQPRSSNSDEWIIALNLRDNGSLTAAGVDYEIKIARGTIRATRVQCVNYRINETYRTDVRRRSLSAYQDIMTFV